MSDPNVDLDKYEPTDWASRPVKIAAIAGSTFLVVALLASALTVKLVTRYRHQTDEPAVFDVKKAPPPPLLQQNPSADLEAFRARENELLTTYGWVDKQAGVVRLPIERAMELVVRERKDGTR